MSPDNHMQAHIKNTGHTFGKHTHTCYIHPNFAPVQFSRLRQCEIHCYQSAKLGTITTCVTVPPSPPPLPSPPLPSPPHTLTAVELNYGTVYCFKCKDYVYDAAIDEVSRSLEQQLAHKKYHVSRQPVMYVAWEPTKEEIDLLKQNPKRRKVEPGSTIGVNIQSV